MDYSWLVPFLSLFTILAVLVFAIVSKANIEERRHDPNVPKSTLAKDGPQGGITFLYPLHNQMAVVRRRMQGRSANPFVASPAHVEPVLE